MCVCVCKCVHAYVCVCMCVCACLCSCMHVCVRMRVLIICVICSELLKLCQSDFVVASSWATACSGIKAGVQLLQSHSESSDYWIKEKCHCPMNSDLLNLLLPNLIHKAVSIWDWLQWWEYHYTTALTTVIRTHTTALATVSRVPIHHSVGYSG